MHEFSIATSIVEIVNNTFQESEAKRITSVEIDVGTLSGVVIDALQFAMDAAGKETALKDAHILIHEIQARARCRDCKKEFELDDFFSPCPHCHSVNSDIIAGKELRVKSIDVEQ